MCKIIPISLNTFFLSIHYPGVENKLLSEATMISHDATNWQPAAAAKPFTFAITGTGALYILRIMSVSFWNTSVLLFSGSNSLRLCPADHTGPLAAKTIQRKSLFSQSFVKALDMEFNISNDKLLRVLASFRQISRTPLHCVTSRHC